MVTPIDWKLPGLLPCSADDLAVAVSMHQDIYQWRKDGQWDKALAILTKMEQVLTANSGGNPFNFQTGIVPEHSVSVLETVIQCAEYMPPLFRAALVEAYNGRS